MRLLTIIGCYFLCMQMPAHASCVENAATWHEVNPWILLAIASVESDFRPEVISHDSNGTQGFGLTQVNSVHLPELAKKGIAKKDLLEPCTSIYVAAWLLRKKMVKFGNTCRAIGAYHSETQKYNQIYIGKIRTALARWGVPLAC